MFTTVSNKRIHYELSGTGPTLVFLHGWGGSIDSLRSLANLANDHYQTLLVDLPGFGKSDLPEQDWGAYEYKDILIQLFKKLNLSEINIIGHSFGGSLAVLLAAKHPELIKHLILANISFKREQRVSTNVKKWRQIQLKYLPFLSYFEAPIRYCFYKIFHPQSDILKYPKLESNFRKIVTEDLTEFTKQITQPTLILWGKDDAITPVSWAYELKQNIPNSTLKIFPNIRHNLPLKYPELVWKEMEVFLANKIS